MPISNDLILRRAYLQASYAAQVEDEKLLYRNRAFYDGEQGIALTARQKEYLGDIANDLDDQALCNVSKRCVSIPLERLAVESITSADSNGSSFADAASAWWEINQLGSWQYDTYEDALRDEVSCLIVGWDTDHPTYTLNELYDGVNGAVRLHYSEDDGSLMFASKRWHPYDMAKLAPSTKTRLTLYLPDEVVRFEDDSGSPDGWRMLSAQEAGIANPQPWVDAGGQPLGIPVIPFWNPGGSELDDILMPQKAMNKALADLLSAQDLQGFPLMALKGYKAAPDATGKAPSLKISPGAAIPMDAASSIERIPGVDLAPMFNTGVLGWLQLISIIKGWPLYLLMNGQPPSGVALKVMESSLIAQVKRKQEGFKDSWLEAFNMGARLHETFMHQTLTGELEIEWKDPETEDEVAKWQALSTKWTAAEIPVQQRWHEAGYNDEEIANMEAKQASAAAEAARQSIMAALFTQRTMPMLGNEAVPQQLMSGNGTAAVEANG